MHQADPRALFSAHSQPGVPEKLSTFQYFQFSSSPDVAGGCLLELPAIRLALAGRQGLQVMGLCGTPGRVIFALSLSSQAVWVAGYQLGPGDIWAFLGSSQASVVCAGLSQETGEQVLLVSLPEVLWRQHLSCARWMPLAHGGVWATLVEPTCRSIQTLCARVRHLADTRNFYGDRRRAQIELEQQLLTVLVHGLGAHRDASRAGIPHTTTRARLVERALAYCQRQPSGRLTVKSVTEALHTSMRTLEYAFSEVLGISPKQYLMRLQMNQVRQLLCANHAGALRVKDVLAEFGVTNLGRFAAEYRQLFGESPAQTLRGHNSGSAVLAESSRIASSRPVPSPCAQKRAGELSKI